MPKQPLQFKLLAAAQRHMPSATTHPPKEHLLLAVDLHNVARCCAHDNVLIMRADCKRPHSCRLVQWSTERLKDQLRAALVLFEGAISDTPLLYCAIGACSHVP